MEVNTEIKQSIELLHKVLPGGHAFQLTSTMLEKSIIDANAGIREFLNKYSIFDFDDLAKGEKEYLDCQLFSNGRLYIRQVSFYRPSARPDQPGDPRIWIYNLNKNAKPNDWIYFAFRDNIFFVVPISIATNFNEQVQNVFGEVNYKVSSGLKNLIGKQLITDEFVAIFELVKNSFDAHSKTVDVIFQALGTSDAKIIIQDYGKGMNFEELKNKWLFVGYSAKREGTEDNDYRHSLGVKKIFAGAKGVGRFSCDRLGAKLKLITRKDEPDSSTEVIFTDWKKFEENAKARFEDIGIKHEVVPKGNDLFDYGTRLEISELHDDWGRERLLDLRLSLEKLILPTIGDEQYKDEKRREFTVTLVADNEKDADNAVRDELGEDLNAYYKIVNGPVKNLIFETLDLKTTSIEVKISADGEIISTTLTDRGIDIYRISEKNIYNLNGVHFKLYHLNQSAKVTFARRMGFPIMYYGHVFLYKNGFRIYPFGDYQEDGFSVDLRKSDKEFSRIGTRSLSGRIEIIGDKENVKFIESTSRDAGLIQNEYFLELRDCYHDVLKRFEKYVVDVIRWGKNIQVENLTEDEHKEKMLGLISEITGSDSIIQLWYNEDIVDILASKQEDSAKTLLKNLQNAADKIGDNRLINEIQQAQHRISELEIVTKQAEEIAENAKITVDEARKALEFEQQKNKYLLATDKNLSDDMRSLLHNVKIVTEKIYLNIDILTDKIKQNELESEELLERLGSIRLNADRAFRMSKLITKADFRGQQDKITVEVASYVQEYIEEYNSLFETRKLKFEFHRIGLQFFRKISILDLSIVIDNLISNSVKKGADKIRIDFKTMNDNKLEVLFSDNGSGLSKEFINTPDIIFDLGITDTDGSGIGLHTVRRLLKENDATVCFHGNGVVLKGATMKLVFN